MARLAKLFVCKLLILAIVSAHVLAPTGARAGERRSLIHDTEVETTIRDLATPLFQAAGLTPESIDIYIVQDDTLNAFVAGGQNIFLYTGLLLETDTPEQLAGVIAHETGHIAGGHLVRTVEQAERASNTALLAFILGAATAIAVGRGDAATAIMSGSQQFAERTFMQFSRAQESIADQSALRYLDATKETSRGLMEFLGKLQGQELLTRERRSAYAGTHPLSQERIATVRAHTERSPYGEARLPDAVRERHLRMVAKLHGFIEPPIHTFRRYPRDDTSLPARYARAIATYRKAETDQAVALVDELLAEKPDDPYFHELKGQILFEAGRIAEAEPPYRRANELLPQRPLIELGLAQTLLALNRDEKTADALILLEHATRARTYSSFAWRQLAIAQGRLGMREMAALSLAEEAMLLGQGRNAVQQAKRAQAGLPRGSAAWLRAVDIEELAKRLLAEAAKGE